MPYNLTGLVTNSTDIVTFTQGVNSNLTGGVFMFSFMIGLFVVMVSSFFFTSRDWGKSFSAASFICLLLSLLLTAMNMIPVIMVFGFLIATAGSVAFTFRNQ